MFHSLSQTKNWYTNTQVKTLVKTMLVYFSCSLDQNFEFVGQICEDFYLKGLKKLRNDVQTKCLEHWPNKCVYSTSKLQFLSNNES